jgi:formylmethanofuran dehydrogenase subunit D
MLLAKLLPYRVWQSIYLDQENDFGMDRLPHPFLELNPEDMKELGLNAGDLIEIYNDNGSTQAMAQPRPTAKRKQTFRLFAYPTGAMGNVVSKGVNELTIPTTSSPGPTSERFPMRPRSPTGRPSSFRSIRHANLQPGARIFLALSLAVWVPCLRWRFLGRSVGLDAAPTRAIGNGRQFRRPPSVCHGSATKLS